MHNHHNGLKTVTLFGLIWALLLGMGWVVATWLGSSMWIWLFGLIGLGTTFYSYWNSGKLAIRAMHAYPVSEAQAPAMIDSVRQALYASKISAYAQGMAMLHLASIGYDYTLDLAAIASIWRAGCIIRAQFLNRITEAYNLKPDLANLLLDPALGGAVAERLTAWRRVVQLAVGMGIPTPAFSASLAYYDSYSSARLPANLIQAQRDYFGSHTYRRIDKEGSFSATGEWVSHTGEVNADVSAQRRTLIGRARGRCRFDKRDGQAIQRAAQLGGDGRAGYDAQVHQPAALGTVAVQGDDLGGVAGLQVGQGALGGLLVARISVQGHVPIFTEISRA